MNPLEWSIEGVMRLWGKDVKRSFIRNVIAYNPTDEQLDEAINNVRSKLYGR